MGQVQETALNLLTREGAVSCYFQPELTPEQCTTLVETVRDADTKVDLVANLRRFAAKWGVRVRIDAGP